MSRVFVALNEDDCELVRDALAILQPDDEDAADRRDQIIETIDQFLAGNHQP